ncbi:MAG TPA: hypothetical protein VHX60_04840 [Acidobacteriaceae bacterium]|jgi:hypothetical protein|nr:hypothetical protein [Acidobacteriaceae bacterium]
MNTNEIVQAIQQEIDTLTRVKALLAGGNGGGHIPSPLKKSAARKNFVMSAEARAKIAAAQRKRWAKQKAAGK